MLLQRSILLQVCIVLMISQCQCQDYEASYGDGESNLQESDHQDYSKYYSVDTSAPLISGQASENVGFTSPIEFAGFFGPSPLEFGASQTKEVTKNPFAAKANEQLGFASNIQQTFPEFSSGFPKDFFEEAQIKDSQKEAGRQHAAFAEINLTPGPNYISHSVPASRLEGGYSGPEAVTQKAQAQKESKKDYDYDYKEAEKASSEEEEKYKTPDYSYDYTAGPGKLVDYNTGKSSSTVSQQPKAAGYNKYNAKPAAATPYQKYSFQPTEGEGFKSKYLDTLISTVAPFNPSYGKVVSTAASLPEFESQPSDNMPKHLQGKNCRRVRKSIGKDAENGREKREAMNCFVCENPASSEKFTQCSYEAAPEATNDYSQTSETYSTPHTFRYKRYSDDEKALDPYEYVRQRARASYPEASETKDYEDYKIPDFYTDEEEKSYSEIQGESISKNAENCVQKETDDGMTCTVCKDPKSGGNYEQCSYTSAPKEQKYAYVTEKKYDSADDPVEEGSESKQEPSTQGNEKSQAVESKKYRPPVEKRKSKNYKSKDPKPSSSTEPKADFSDKIDKLELSEEYHKALEEYKDLADKASEDVHRKTTPYSKSKSPKKAESEASEEYGTSEEYFPDHELKSKKPAKKLVDDDPYDVPKHFAESTLTEQKTSKAPESSYYGSDESAESGEAASSEASKEDEGNAESAESENSESEEVSPYKDIDEYHFKLFPEFTNEESQQAEVVAGEAADATRKDVEEVLAEFTKKDRTSCKKAEKKGMTCYLCVDANGIQHEECMYVSESKPKASHVAYHEVKQIKSPENAAAAQQQPQQTQQVPQTAEPVTAATTEIKRKHFFKKVGSTSAPFTLAAAASEEIETKIKYEKPKNNKKRRSPKKYRRSEREEEEEDEDHEKSPTNNSYGKIEHDLEKIDDEGEPETKTPEEFVVADEEGAYSAETKPIYSKAHGTVLPKYMVEQSEFEKEFDDFSKTFN